MSDQLEIGPCYYFGCLGQIGHYLYDEAGRKVWKSNDSDLNDFAQGHIDARFLKKNKPQKQGEAVIEFVGKWTVIQFWDRSMDKRMGSNSSFIIPYDVGFQKAVEIAKERFPQVWQRFAFDVFHGEQ